MKRQALLLALAFILIALSMAAKPLLVAPPALRSANGPGEFGTGRALARLQRILADQAPHPVDSPAGDLVRGRLVAELRAIGLEPQLRDDIACTGRGTGASCARVRNVVASIGAATGKRLLLASHYDSTPAGPGAADDGIGVAVMLETAAQLARQPAARPVTFLFDEGEEAGLLGAKAFLEHDPLARDVDTLLNFEARGVNGPAEMFETSVPNGAAISAYRAAPHPAANSLSTDFYRMIPNSTDVSVFAQGAKWTTLNFAIIGNETRYHSPGDRLDALDPRSVQHMGDQALAVSTRLAAGSPAPDPGTKVFADILGTGLVALPLGFALVLLAILLAFFIVVAWRRRQGLGRSAATVLAGLAGAAAVAFVAQWLLALVRAGDFWRGHPQAIAAASDLSALLAVAAALALVGRGAGRERLRTAYWLIFLLVGAAVALAAPGGSIFFLLPPLVVGIGTAVEPHRRRSEQVAGILAVILLFLTWAPLLQLMEVLLDFHAAWMFAALAATIVTPALIELLPLIRPLPARIAITPALLLALGAWLWAALSPAYSSDRKQRLGIEYVRQGDSGRWMAVNDGAPLPAGFAAAGRFQPNVKVPYSTRWRWAAPAPLLPAPMPAIETLADTSALGQRLLTLRIRSNGAQTVVLSAPASAGLRAVRAGDSGVRFSGNDPFSIRCQGRSCDGMTIRILAAVGRPIDWTMTAIASGLPSEAAPLVVARPANAQPQYGPDATIAIARVRT